MNTCESFEASGSGTPWKTVVCDKTSADSSTQCKLRSTIPAKGNMEGFVDLTAFLGDNFNLCPGFSQATFKTRSSDGLNASLQDTTVPTPLRTNTVTTTASRTDRRQQSLHIIPDPFVAVRDPRRCTNALAGNGRRACVRPRFK